MKDVRGKKKNPLAEDRGLPGGAGFGRKGPGVFSSKKGNGSLGNLSKELLGGGQGRSETPGGEGGLCALGARN